MLGTTNISTTLVKNTIGETSNSVGALCSSPNVNMWSKYKPVRFPADETYAYPDWWKSSNGNCGIKYNTYNTIRDLIYAAEQGRIEWEYERPTGGHLQPFRLGDFRKYNHDAKPAAEPMPEREIIHINDPNLMFPVAMNYIASEREDNITLMDIGGDLNFKDMYFACGIRPVPMLPGETTTYDLDWNTSELTIGEGGYNTRVPIGKYIGQDVWLYYFMCNATKAEVDNGRAPTFVPLPFPTWRMTVAKAEITTEATVTWTKNETKFDITFYNPGNDIIYTDCRVNIRYADNTLEDDYWERGEISTPLGYEISLWSLGTTRIYESYGLALPDYATRGGHMFLECTIKGTSEKVIYEFPITRPTS